LNQPCEYAIDRAGLQYFDSTVLDMNSATWVSLVKIAEHLKVSSDPSPPGCFDLASTIHAPLKNYKISKLIDDLCGDW